MLDQTIFTNGYSVSTTTLASGEKNDCTVRAISNAFNVCYDTAHEFAATMLGRKNRQGVKGFDSKMASLKSVSFSDNSEQLSLFPQSNDYNVTPLRTMQLINPTYTHKRVKFTVKTFMQRFTKGTYIITVKDHALVIKDGVVIDNPNYQFTGYRRPVINAFVISQK
jgi:hypothetical protein